MPPGDTSASTKPALRLVPLDSADRRLAAVAAELHLRLLPTSPAVLLGPRFLRDFYYTLLPAHSLIRVTVACIDEVPAGFVVLTSDPDGFMNAALRRWWYRLAWTLFVSVLAQPLTRLGALREAYQIMSARSGLAQPPHTAELLSLGVLPQFAHPKFVQDSGLRIARELINDGVRRLNESGAQRIIAIVDADNRIAQMMYYGLGWRLSEVKPTGWRTPTVEFYLDFPGKPEQPIEST